MTEDDARRSLVEACRSLNATGLNQGTSGNISLRRGDRMLISPSATPYELMQPDQVAVAALEQPRWQGPLPPSTEWRMHHALLRARPECGAVVHSHPPFCTALAVARRPIPACHYMVAAFGGTDVRCADYATFGTEALAEAALRALAGRHACLLASHGMVVTAPTLRRAMWLATELEALARQYHGAALLGPVPLLTDDEVAETAARLAGYGVRD